MGFQGLERIKLCWTLGAGQGKTLIYLLAAEMLMANEATKERFKKIAVVLPIDELKAQLERVCLDNKISKNVTAICLGKSTYARVGLIANTTPLEASWRGAITLEFSNASSTDCRIYANEGVVQLLFFEGAPCQTTYSDRGGKYQDQVERVTLPRV